MQISRSSSGSDIKSGADSSSRFWSNEAAAALCSTDVEMTNENVHIWAWSSRLWEETECFACMFFIRCPAETRILHIHHIPAHFIPLNISTSHSSSTRVMIYISTQQPLLPPQIDFFSRRKRPSLSLTLTEPAEQERRDFTAAAGRTAINGAQPPQTTRWTYSTSPWQEEDNHMTYPAA